MRKYLMQISGFTFVTVIGFIILNYIQYRWFEKNNFQSKFSLTVKDLDSIDTKSDIDILVLGSSHAYRHYDPRIFKQYGFNLFNLGSSSQTPKQSYYLLKDFLMKKRPNFVIYDLFPNQFYVIGEESDLELLANYDNLNTDFKLLTEDYTFLKLKIFIYQLMAQKINPTLPENDLKNEVYIGNGFFQKKKMSYFSKDEEIKKNKKRNKQISDYINQNQWEYFESTLKVLDSAKISYFIIESPSTTYYKNNSESIEDFRQKIRESNITYWSNSSFNQQFDDSLDYFDAHHLNQRGADKFSKMVLNRIIENK